MPDVRLEEYKKIRLAGDDRELLRILYRQDLELTAETARLRKKLAKAVRRRNEGQLAKIVPILIATYGAFLRKTVKKYGTMASKSAGKNFYNAVKKAVPAHSQRFLSDLSKEISSHTQKTAKSILYRPSRFDKIRLTHRIKSVERSAIKTVRNIITVGHREGKGAYKIAGEIDRYIKPSLRQPRVSSWRLYRDRFGKPLSYRPPVRTGSVSYNALRIARTETADLYRLEMIELARDKPWIEGINWVLSHAHPKPDICNDWADGSPYKPDEIIGFGHPHCICYTESVPVSKDKFGEYLEKEYG